MTADKSGVDRALDERMTERTPAALRRHAASHPLNVYQHRSWWYEQRALEQVAEALHAANESDPGRAERAIRIGNLYAAMFQAAVDRETATRPAESGIDITP